MIGNGMNPASPDLHIGSRAGKTRGQNRSARTLIVPDLLSYPEYTRHQPQLGPLSHARDLSPSVNSIPSHDVPTAPSPRPRSPVSRSSPDPTTSGDPPVPSRRKHIESADVLQKRQRNTIAARKYRQKKIDRIDELERALEQTVRERDELRLRLAAQKAETETYRSMMRKDR